MRNFLRLLAAAAALWGAPVMAQQPAAPGPTGVEVPVKPHPAPHLLTWRWENPGASRLNSGDILPKFGRGNDQDDVESIIGAFLGLPGYEAAHRLTWVAMDRLNGGQPWHPQDKEKILNLFRNGAFKLRKRVYPPEHIFYGPMVFRDRDINGTPQITVKGRPITTVDTEAWVTDPFRPEYGMWAGHDLTIVIPTVCFNLTLDEAVVVQDQYLPAETASLRDRAEEEARQIAVQPPVAPVAPPAYGETPWYKRKSVMIPLIAAGAAIATCAIICKGGEDTETIVVRDARKGGSSGPGPSPAAAPPSGGGFSIRF